MGDQNEGPELSEHTRDIGRYTSAHLIGRGGFGSVYRATDAEHGREVAIKVLQGTLGEAQQRRFDRERQTMGRLGSHPNIMPIHDSGYTEVGEGYIVMDLATGGSLQDRLASTGPVPWSEAAPIMAAIASATQAAHDHGVLHRDIKPDNVLIDKFGNPKLSDFGIAAVASNATATTSTTATLAHAAPEILQGRTATPAADVYAIGSTLYNLVLGLPPFLRNGDDGVTAMVTRALTEPPPDLRLDGVPDGLVEVMERALAKDPDARQATAAQLADELTAALAATDRAHHPAADRARAGSTVSVVGAPRPLAVTGARSAGGPPPWAPPGQPLSTTGRTVVAPAPGPEPPPGIPTGHPFGAGPPTGGPGRGRRAVWIGVGGLLIAALAVGALALSGGGDGPSTEVVDEPTGQGETAGPTATTPPATTPPDTTPPVTTPPDTTPEAAGAPVEQPDDAIVDDVGSRSVAGDGVPAQGRFGSVSLQSGFTPDPFVIDMTSGGPNSASSIDGSCAGFIADEPDYVVDWTGGASQLRFIFVGATAVDDTTLVIDGPDGLWCGDDFEGFLDPHVTIPGASSGRYGIWVGSFEAGQFIDGSLVVTELDITVADLVG